MATPSKKAPVKGRPAAPKAPAKGVNRGPGPKAPVKGVNRGPGNTTATHAAAPAPPAAAPPVAPFLTGAQQEALSTWNAKYAESLSNLDSGDAAAAAKYGTSLAADQFKNAGNVDMTNQSMGARGLFESSIRDNALNDLAVTMTQQTNALQTARDTALLADQTQRTALGGQNDATQTFYNSAAVTNAQGVTPTLTNPTPSNPSSPAAQSAPAPKPIAPVKGVNRGSGNTTPPAGPISARGQAPTTVKSATQRAAPKSATQRAAPKPAAPAPAKGMTRAATIRAVGPAVGIPGLPTPRRLGP